MAVNPGAQVSIDGTKDGLEHVQRDFEEASITDRGIMVTFDADVLFPLNSSYLTDQAKKEIDKLVTLLDDYPGASLIVDGHTDATGTETYNQWLSEKRAESVKQYAVEKGLSERRVTTNGYGQTKPVAANNTKEGRQKNRRVEVTIVAAKK
ncbi:OmpA family protein [Parapedobacter tibetensis]|uniref:OmpA family protein n=1 Tax=Parapedobacter tibetensis TaxID=2972951 RepID=UPI00214D9ABB|nr:OmpA family protein [Parapedobacter tibetensis]